MDKIKLKKQENQLKCCNATFRKDWSFETLFDFCYNLLAEYGDKKELHYAVVSLTNPPVNVGTIRTYCNDLAKVPEKARAWYYKTITAILSRKLQKRIDQKRIELQNAETALQLLSEKLSETLKH